MRRIAFLCCLLAVRTAWAKDLQGSLVLQDETAPRERLAIGLNYTGAQLRWGLSSRWALEGRYQESTAQSNYGDVTARVFGMRSYRFLHPENRFPFYWGAEAAYATA